MFAWYHTVPFFFYTNYWKYVYFFICYFCVQNAYAITMDIFWRLISFQDNWECSICYNFLFRMYCLVTRFSLRLSCYQNFGKYVYMVNLLLQRITVGVFSSFSICLFESNWRNSHILSPPSFIIFTVLDLKSPISLPNKSQM